MNWSECKYCGETILFATLHDYKVKALEPEPKTVNDKEVYLQHFCKGKNSD